MSFSRRNSPSQSKRSWIIRRDDKRCQYCGRRCRVDVPQNHPAFLTIDHVIPRSRGGHPTSEVNRVVACQPCNVDKGHAMPWEIGMWPLNGLAGCWATKSVPNVAVA